MIYIVEYGAGNLGSIENMIQYVGGDAIITSDPDELSKAEKLILPGVGHYDFGMSKLHESGLIPTLNKKVLEDGVPILGICLGAQMMCRGSEEGSSPGLGWFQADVIKFDGAKHQMKVPHMGWNFVKPKKDTALSDLSVQDQRFYFVHSYYMKSENPDDVMYTSTYGDEFASALAKDNFYACQFHPEKSHKYGIEFFKKFLAL